MQFVELMTGITVCTLIYAALGDQDLHNECTVQSVCNWSVILRRSQLTGYQRGRTDRTFGTTSTYGQEHHRQILNGETASNFVYWHIHISITPEEKITCDT